MKRALLVACCLVVAIPLDAARQPVRGRHGMVVTMESIAADVGVSVLQKGGNAVDAAGAVGFAMGVTPPLARHIGRGRHQTVPPARRPAPLHHLPPPPPGT